ncbi:hypothetical protein OC846_003495 [Tilletia horrida]|uniref:SET domain-containing protein n=1 Tax=Tilletia horrida TaxID=155126 RepID=A0AAN6GPY9_9BASI|nr:hypothetical protein OC846_003495 [Tilletia horrida]
MSTSDAIDALLRRFHADALVAVSDDVPAGRGMVLKKDIEPNSIVFHVPGNALLNVKTIADSLHEDLLPTATRPSARQGIKVPFNPDQMPSFSSTHHIAAMHALDSQLELPLSSVQALCLLLTLWRRWDLEDHAPSKPDSFPSQALVDFARTLPSEFATVPLLWSLMRDMSGSEGKLSRALLSSLPAHSLQRLEDVKARFFGDFHVVRSILIHRPELLPGWASAPTVEESSSDQLLSFFYWSWMCVNSRCLYLPLGLKTHEDNFTLAPLEYKVEYPPAGGMQIVAPKSDRKAFNLKTVRRDNGDVQVEEEWQKGCRASDEMFITYGPHSNEFLLSEYGFTLSIVSTQDDELNLATNPYADVVVDDLVLEHLATQPLVQAELKRELLRERSYWLDWTIHPTGEPSHRLVCALRLLVLNLAPSKEQMGATVAALGHKSSKRLKLQHQSGKRSVSIPAAKQDASSQTAPDLANIGDWEAMVSGSRESVSELNEQLARELLIRICGKVKERSQTKRDLLDGAFQDLLAAQTTGDAARFEQGPASSRAGLIQSYEIVRMLLIEQARIAQIVSDTTNSTTEPW